jgi:Type II secretion system (T2SS), protein M subtype b
MTLADRPSLGRVGALAILGVLLALFCIGPLAGYCGLITDNNDALATKAALLQRYRALAGVSPATNTPTPSDPALLYPDMPESQASALLQETVKTAAAAARVQVQGLQVLRGEALSGATRLGVRVRASGDIASLRNLVYAIETARPLLYPDHLQIQSHATLPDAAPSTLDFQLDISGFKAEPQS